MQNWTENLIFLYSVGSPYGCSFFLLRGKDLPTSKSANKRIIARVNHKESCDQFRYCCQAVLQRCFLPELKRWASLKCPRLNDLDRLFPFRPVRRFFHLTLYHCIMIKKSCSLLRKVIVFDSFGLSYVFIPFNWSLFMYTDVIWKILLLFQWFLMKFDIGRSGNNSYNINATSLSARTLGVTEKGMFHPRPFRISHKLDFTLLHVWLEWARH